MNTKRSVKILTIVIFAAAAIAGCGLEPTVNMRTQGKADQTAQAGTKNISNGKGGDGIDPSELPLTYEGAISFYVEQNCLACHNSDLKQGGFDLSIWESSQQGMSEYEKWSRAAVAVVSGTMPPDKRLDKKIVAAFSDWYDLGVPRTEADIDDAQKPITCDTEVIPPSSIKRLSNVQVYETLLDHYAYDAFYKSMNDIFSFVLALIPDDYNLDTGMGNAYEDISETHISSHLILAKHFGAQMSNIDSLPVGDRWDRVYPGCIKPTSSPNDACLTAFIQKEGHRMLKHELTNDEVTRYLALFRTGSNTRDGLALLWSTWTLSPYFLYNIDDRGTVDENDPGLVERTLQERAVQMAYFLTGRAPDAQLNAKVADGSLSNETVFRQEFERLLAASPSRLMPKTSKTTPITHWDRFFQQWLDLVEEPSYENVGGHYEANSGVDYHAAHGNNPVNADMFWLSSMSRKIILGGGRYESYFNAPLTYLPDYTWTGQGPGYLADVYFGGDAENVPVDLPDRRGLLQHVAPAVYNQDNDYVNPIFRGIWVRQHLFCEEPKDFPADLGTPSNTAIPERHAENKHISTRTMVEQVTSPAECQGCHSRWNGIGFAMDTLGSLGELRTMENVFTVENGAHVLANQIPINNTANVWIDGKEVTVNGVNDLQNKIARSKESQRCFVQRLVLNHGIGRNERPKDKCLVNFAQSEMQKTGGNIKDMLFNVLDSDYMRFKRID